jgi:hypothetical protein
LKERDMGEFERLERSVYGDAGYERIRKLEDELVGKQRIVGRLQFFLGIAVLLLVMALLALNA